MKLDKVLELLHERFPDWHFKLETYQHTDTIRCVNTNRRSLFRIGIITHKKYNTLLGVNTIFHVRTYDYDMVFNYILYDIQMIHKLERL